MNTLILVESPTKAKTLTKFLGAKYDIVASLGHIRDLPKGNIGVDFDNNFEPKYVTPKEKRKTIEDLRARVKRADKILLATDPDREGEAISFHLYEVLKKEAKKNAKFERIVFHEITKTAIDEALLHPREIDNNLVDAQTARRILDRIVGYKLSPLLWKKVKRNLSAGRVQSIALRLIVEREREIEKFATIEYYRIFVVLKKGKPVEFELTELDGKQIEESTKLKLYDGEYTYKKTVFDKSLAEQITKDLPNHTYAVTDVTKKQTKRSPLPPFITSTLQQEASRRLSYPSRRTMGLAQKLYEEGYITYHRTDSFNLSTQFLNASREFIEKSFGKKYLSDVPKVYKTKSKVAQEAHEAIRPTNITGLIHTKAQVAKELGNDAAKVYELIYKRAVATQMADALFESTKVTVKTENLGKYTFERAGSVLLFDGYLRLWFIEESVDLLPDFTAGEKLAYLESKLTNHNTTPPPKYNEASLIGALEKNGIGRPSTYATIVSTIQERNYVEKQEGRFTPTPIGITVTDFLVANFETIDDIPFTAAMEDKLDAIANGEIKWVPMMKEFYTPFEASLTLAEGKDRMKVEEETTDKICPLDGGAVIIRRGKFGKFYACANFPECKYTAPFTLETEYKCPKDDGIVIVKKTRKGRNFFGCSNYPNCDFAVWTKAQLLQELGISEEKKEESGASN